MRNRVIRYTIHNLITGLLLVTHRHDKGSTSWQSIIARRKGVVIRHDNHYILIRFVICIGERSFQGCIRSGTDTANADTGSIIANEIAIAISRFCTCEHIQHFLAAWDSNTRCIRFEITALEIDCTCQRCCAIKLTIQECDRTGCLLLNSVRATINRYQLRGNSRLTSTNKNTGFSTGNSSFIKDCSTAVNRNSRSALEGTSVNRQCTNRSQTSFETTFSSNKRTAVCSSTYDGSTILLYNSSYADI